MKRIFFILTFLIFITSSLFSQIELTVKITDIGGNPRPGIATALKFKAYPYTGAYMTGLTVTDQGVGVYLITGFSTFQLVRAYVNDTPNVSFGQKFSGDPLLMFLKLSGGTMTGALNMGNQALYGPMDPATGVDVGDRDYNDARYLKLDGTGTMTGTLNCGNQGLINVLDPTTDAGVGDRGYNDLRYGQLLQLNDWASPQIFEGKITCMGGLDAQNTAFVNFKEPSNPQDAATKHYVDQQIAGVPLTPFQESVNRVRVMGGGTVQPGKVYNNIHDASNYFATPGAGNQCLVQVEGCGTTGAYLNISTGSLRDYVNLSGSGRHVQVLMEDGSSNSKIVIFENMTIYLGAGTYGDRTFANMKFINCRIFAYRNTNFINCELTDCEIIHASTYKAYLIDDTRAFGCYFNNEFNDAGLITGAVLNCGAGFAYTMPNDPTIL
jgi:hypothetical protein